MNIMETIFENRSGFAIIGLTGRTACGCTTCGEILQKSFTELELETKFENIAFSNESRKDRIIYRYAMKKWKPFYYIKVSDVITSFLLENTWDTVLDYLDRTFSKDYPEVKTSLMSYGKKYGAWHNDLKNFNDLLGKQNRLTSANKVLSSMDRLKECSAWIHTTLNQDRPEFYTRVFQRIGDNIRKFGKAFPTAIEQPSPEHIYSLVERVNGILKAIKETPTKRFVIDAIRNPLEAVYFKERYGAFYLFAVNTKREDRHSRLIHLLKYSQVKIEELEDRESGRTEQDATELDRIVTQNIPECIQKADVHIANPGGYTNVSRVSLTRQLVRYVVLIEHPGLISPTADERIMQIAFTAKENSCCISRKVGAVVVNGNDKIEGIGWNDVPQGQTGCSLRSIDDLLSNFDSEAYSQYELENLSFRKVAKEQFPQNNFTAANGLPKPFCFKDIKNAIDKKGNQIHTRALHAEENAFLQSVKKGGDAVQGGTLYSTAETCELCAKKAYQLGLKRIVYIDPYPGISEQHIYCNGLEEFRPKVELFSGAIGQAYFRLYSPIVNYKDELRSRLNHYCSVNQVAE